MYCKRQSENLLTKIASNLDSGLALELKGWIELAVAALSIAGFLSLVAVIARIPVLQEFLPWPWENFFPKTIVTHVDLSIVVWFQSIFGGITVLATSQISGGRPHWRSLGPFGLALSMISTAMLLLATLLNLGEASLNNYIPVLVHPMFYIGLGCLALGVSLLIIRLLSNLPNSTASSFEYGVAATGITFLVAVTCFVLTWTAIPTWTDTMLANERLFWGGGHILQFVNTMIMLLAWYVLSESIINGIPPRLFTAVMWALAALSLLGILFCWMFDVMDLKYHEVFTQLLWYGLAMPSATITIVVFIRFIKEIKKLVLSETAALSLFLSLILFTIGGISGYFLDAGDTRIPSHYHATIGGVNIAIMGMVFILFVPLLQKMPPARIVKWSLLLYGGGQLAFSVGMFAAGVAGVPRKTAGLEQGLDTVAKYVYMALYGAGSIIAIIGGVLFVWAVVLCFFTKKVESSWQ